MGTYLREICKSVATHLLVLLRILLEHLIHFSCAAKHRISIVKKSKFRHYRDRWLKDIYEKKNLEGKMIERALILRITFGL